MCMGMAHNTDYLYSACIMKVHLLEMRRAGIALRRKQIFDRFNHGNLGELTIAESTDQGLHRLVQLARFTRGTYEETLFEPRLLWMNEGRFMLTGFQRRKTEDGIVEYAQSWLCLTEDAPDLPEGR